MPFLTNFFGWDFFVLAERRGDRWVGVVRIVCGEGAAPTTVRGIDLRDDEADARSDAKALAHEWSERLERSPQSARKVAERELLQRAKKVDHGVFEEFEIRP